MSENLKDIPLSDEELVNVTGGRTNIVNGITTMTIVEDGVAKTLSKKKFKCPKCHLEIEGKKISPATEYTIFCPSCSRTYSEKELTSSK